MKLSGIMLFCEDIRTLITFYRDVLGLIPDDPQPFSDHRFYRFRAGTDVGLSLHSGTKPNGGRQKLVFEVDSIQGLCNRLRRAGKRVRKPKPQVGTMVFDFRDPEGNRIQVYGPYGSP